MYGVIRSGVDVLNRGIQLYLVVLAIVSAIAATWATNRFILDNTTAGTGWAVMIGIAVSLVTVGLVVRYLRLPTDPDPPGEDYPW